MVAARIGFRLMVTRVVPLECQRKSDSCLWLLLEIDHRAETVCHLRLMNPRRGGEKKKKKGVGRVGDGEVIHCGCWCDLEMQKKSCMPIREEKEEEKSNIFPGF